MGNNETYRGKNDGIILFILSKGARHTDELKEIIDNNFSVVKLGTLYSIISRLKTSNYVSEYRASSIDGSRRKYYKLTKKGEDYFNANLLDSFNDVSLNLSTSFTEQPINSTEKIETTTQIDEEIEIPNIKVEETTTEIDSKNYSDIINESVINNEEIEEIDFSSIQTEEETPSISVDEPIFEENFETNIEPEPSTDLEVRENYVPFKDDYSASNPFNEQNQDSRINSRYEYNKVLNKLFPKQQIIVDEFEEKTETEPIIEENKQTDWSEIYNLAEKDGIKVRTSSDTNRYQGSKILLTGLLLCSTFATLLFAVLNYLLFTFIIPNTFNGKTLSAISIIFGFIFVCSLIAFSLNPHLKVKTLPRFIDLLEIALIIIISTLIISFAITAIKEIDYSNPTLVFNNLVLPFIISLNLLVYVLSTYLLSKLEIFETI